MKIFAKLVVVSGLLLLAACKQTVKQEVVANNKSDFKMWATTPPMGWNSYDAYHGAVTEKQFLQAVDTLEKKLLPLGYNLATIDFCWFNPGPEGWDPANWSTFPLRQTRDEKGMLTPKLAMDNYGRLLPSENRFPSAKNDVGFKVIGEYLHSKNMKFGIHIMRGIARQAVELNTPIKKTYKKISKFTALHSIAIKSNKKNLSL